VTFRAVPAVAGQAAQCRASGLQGGHRTCRLCPPHRLPATSSSGGHRRRRARRARLRLPSRRLYCLKRPPLSRWLCRPRLHRNPRAGLRLPRHRRPHNRRHARKTHWRLVIRVPRRSPTPIASGTRSTSGPRPPATSSRRRSPA
jgi:hypothetical protein